MKLPDNFSSARKTVYSLLLLLAGLFTLAAILTLIPNPAASWPNIMGYKSICTFAPAATIVCASLAAITCIIRRRVVKKDTSLPVAGPIVILLILAGLFAWSFSVYLNVKSHTDSVSSASQK